MRPGVVVDRRFRVDREVARGGMGTVYRGHDLVTARPVAIKVVRDPEIADDAATLDDAATRSRFEREIGLLATLADPRIVRYVGHGELPDGRGYLVAEWVDGAPLATVLEQGGLTMAESVAIVVEIARGLATAHAAGIVHRDVKPSNVLVVARGPRVKLIDFGIARRAGDALHVTRTGMVIGTPGYMAPEQIHHASAVDARADVFSLGCMLYECLTGRPAFAGRSLTAVRAKVLVHEPPAPDHLVPDVPPALSLLVSRLLAKDPALRPRDGAEVADALAAIRVAPGGPRRAPYAGEPLTDEHATSQTRDAGVIECVVIADVATTPAAAPLDAAVAPHRGRIERMSDGTALVTVSPTLPADQQVLLAARCALALGPHVDGPIVLAAAVRGPDDLFAEAIDEGLGVLTVTGVREAPGTVAIAPAYAAPLRAAGFVVDEVAGGRLILRRGPRAPQSLG